MACHSSFQIVFNSLITLHSYIIQSIILFPASYFINAILFVAQDILYPRPPSPPAIRTITHHRTTFTRPGPGAVIYDVSQAAVVTITLPPQSTWTSGPHWHENHTEYLQVVEGLARVMLHGKTRVYGHSDGIIEIPKLTIHEWQREAKGYARVDGEESRPLVVREWTMPADGKKEIFFRMLNSYLLEPEPQKLHRRLPLPHFLVAWLEEHVVLLQLLVIFRAMDNWPIFDDETETVGWRTWGVTHAYVLFARLGGAVLGLSSTYEKYLGDDLVAKRNRQKPANQRRID